MGVSLNLLQEFGLRTEVDAGDAHFHTSNLLVGIVFGYVKTCRHGEVTDFGNVETATQGEFFQADVVQLRQYRCHITLGERAAGFDFLL